MRFEYTGRHLDVTPPIRKHVEAHLRSSLMFLTNDRLDSRNHRGGKDRQIAEVIVHWRDHTLTAKDINADMYMALTRVIGKIETQALKLKQKMIDRKQGPSYAAVAPNRRTTGSYTAAATNHRRAALFGKPMTAEEAALRLPRNKISSCVS